MGKLSNYSKRYIENEKKRFIVHVFLSLVAFGLLVFTPLLGSWLIDVLSNSRSFAMLIRPAIYTMSANVISILVSYISTINMVAMLSNCQYSAISDAITHIQKISLGMIDSSFDAAYLTQRITSDVNTVINFYCEHYFQKYLYAGCIVVIGLILLSIDPSFLVICILFSVIYVGIYLFLKKPLANAVEQNKETTAMFHKALFNRLRRVVPIKIGVLFNEDASYAANYFYKYQKELLGYNKIAQIFSSLEGAISATFQVVVLIVGGIRIINNNMTIGQYLIINSYFSFFIKSIKYYFGYAKAYQGALVSYDRLRTLLDIKEEENGTFSPSIISQVLITNMEFSFHPDGSRLFNQFCLELKMPGLWILKGENGTGKTTLINILIGMIKPNNKKCVEVNGRLHNIDWYTLRRKNISVLLQDEEKADISVDEYFSFYHGKSLDSIAKEITSPILKDLFFGTAFNLLKLRDQPIIYLSGGEWQRIRLFKALIKDADIYFLDEPANNLDRNSIIALREFITELKEEKIIVIAAHDTFFDSIADDVVWLERGGGK